VRVRHASTPEVIIDPAEFVEPRTATPLTANASSTRALSDSELKLLFRQVVRGIGRVLRSVELARHGGEHLP
jgi:hypothetical protein